MGITIKVYFSYQDYKLSLMEESQEIFIGVVFTLK